MVKSIYSVLLYQKNKNLLLKLDFLVMIQKAMHLNGTLTEIGILYLGVMTASSHFGTAIKNKKGMWSLHSLISTSIKNRLKT